MITNFKIFESEEINFFKNSCWSIYGSQYNCLKILEKLKIQLTPPDNEDFLLKLRLLDIYKSIQHGLDNIIEEIKSNIRQKIYLDDILGINIYYSDKFTDTLCLMFDIFYDEENRKRNFENLKYRGEIKEVNGKIIVDDTELYTNKYNL